jgi:hypothetical protein
MIATEKQEDNDNHLIRQWEEEIKSHTSAIESLKDIDMQSLRVFCE